MVLVTFSLLLIREIAFIGSGLALCHMAYKLFIAGVQDGGAEEMTLGKYLKVKGGGPGIVFVTLGAMIILYTISTSTQMEPDEMKTLLEGEEIPAPAAPTGP